MLYTDRLWCEDFRAAVQQVLDGANLAVPVRQGMRAHREACPACCEFHDRLVQVAALSEDLLPPAEYEAENDVELWKKIVKTVK